MVLALLQLDKIGVNVYILYFYHIYNSLNHDWPE